MRIQKTSTQNSTIGVNPTVSWRVKKVEILEDYCLAVTFNDGIKGLVDMKGLIFSDKAGVFSELKDKNIFNKAHLNLGAVTWPGDIDLAPDAMYHEIKKHGKWALKQ